MRSFICPDCLGIMRVFDLYDYYCKKVNMKLSIEHQACLQCGNAVMQIINMGPPESESAIGRTESMEITCAEHRSDVHIKQAVLYDLVKNYYANIIHGLCYELFGKPWVNGFEILLWEAVHDMSADIELNAEEMLRLRSLYENTQLWLINPGDWNNRKDQPDIAFVSINEWSWMYKNKEQLRIENNDKLAHAGTGDASEDPELEK